MDKKEITPEVYEKYKKLLEELEKLNSEYGGELCSLYRKERREKWLKQKKEEEKKYYQTKEGKQELYRREYYEKNKEKMLEYSRKYRERKKKKEFKDNE